MFVPSLPQTVTLPRAERPRLSRCSQHIRRSRRTRSDPGASHQKGGIVFGRRPSGSGQSSVKGDGAYGAIKPLPALAGRRGYYGKRSTQEEREARKRSETAKRRLWRGEQVVPAFPANLLV